MYVFLWITLYIRLPHVHVRCASRIFNPRLPRHVRTIDLACEKNDDRFTKSLSMSGYICRWINRRGMRGISQEQLVRVRIYEYVSVCTIQGGCNRRCNRHPTRVAPCVHTTDCLMRNMC